MDPLRCQRGAALRHGWLHVLEGVANSSAQGKICASGVSALKAACGVHKAVGSQAWLKSQD